MTKREQDLRSSVKWNRIAVYCAVPVAFANALLGSAFCFVLLGLAAMNWVIAKQCERQLKEEFPEE
jgi:hypothetical protein